MPRKLPPESSVPCDNLNRGSRRNQLRRGHGSPPVLSEVLHELSTDAHSKECKRSPQQFIPAGFPLHNQLPTGTEDSAIPLTTPDMIRSGRVLPTSVKSSHSSPPPPPPAPAALVPPSNPLNIFIKIMCFIFFFLFYTCPFRTKRRKNGI